MHNASPQYTAPLLISVIIPSGKPLKSVPSRVGNQAPILLQKLACHYSGYEFVILRPFFAKKCHVFSGEGKMAHHTLLTIFFQQHAIDVPFAFNKG